MVHVYIFRFRIRNTTKKQSFLGAIKVLDTDDAHARRTAMDILLTRIEDTDLYVLHGEKWKLKLERTHKVPEAAFEAYIKDFFDSTGRMPADEDYYKLN